MASINDVISVLEDTLKDLKLTLTNKGSDYSGTEDTFKNFRLSEDVLDISVKKAIMIRLLDKVSRMGNLLDKTAKVEDESLYDTIDDLIGYSILLKTALYFGTCRVSPDGSISDESISDESISNRSVSKNKPYSEDKFSEIGHD